MTIVPMTHHTGQAYELGFDTGYAAGLEMAATKLQAWTRLRPSELCLLAGKMNAQEARMVIAVLNGLTGAIRAMKKDVP